MEPKAWLHGTLVPLSEATIGVYDLALLRGFGIYEGLAAHDGEPFHFHDHFRRFESSAKALDLTLPFSEEETLAGMRAVVAANAPTGRAIVRMLLTGGVADGGIKHVMGREKLFILAEPMTPFPQSWFDNGAHVITSTHKRSFPSYKTIDYTAAVLLQPRIAEAKAAEALYTWDDNALECTGSNIFAVKNGTLVTPKDDILLGITRKVTLALARDAGIPVEERVLPLRELLAADEAFITSSFKDIVPVVTINENTIGAGAPGALTQDLMTRFRAAIQAT